jgi:hypothetical protein
MKPISPDWRRKVVPAPIRINMLPAHRDVADFVPSPEPDRDGDAIETEENDIREHFHEKLRPLLRGGLSAGAAAATPAGMQPTSWWQP